MRPLILPRIWQILRLRSRFHNPLFPGIAID